MSNKRCAGVAVGVLVVFMGLNAQAVDLFVKGSIVPPSCSFNLTQSTFDYGRIQLSSLSATQFTKLERQSTPFTIECDGDTLVSIKTQDNRTSSVVPGMMKVAFNSTFTDVYNYGLGVSANNEKVGGYILHMGNSVADGKAVRVLRSKNNGVSWYAGDGYIGQAPHLTSWAPSGNVVPVKLTTVSGDLAVQAVINKTSEFTAGSDISLDGNVVLELNYL